MYSRKEKVESARNSQSQNEGILELFSMLESPDPQSVESVKNVIHENLSGAKDSRLLHGLVDYYMAVQSKRSLDILVRVREPHDKHLFDKLTESMKNESTRYKSLQLLCNLIYKQPSWLYKIVLHRLMNTLLNVLKTDTEAPNLLCALFAVICLLPMIPSQFSPFLSDSFDIFSRLAAWTIKKPIVMPEICSLHLQIGVYSLFHRLYGMYPCNFLAYLRSYYGGRDHNENLKVFTSVIKPMLERVRLHPLLVTASKETELNANRWKKMAAHDIVVDCASVSLDATEGSLAGMRGQNSTFSSISSSQIYALHQDSLQQVSFSSQSSSTSITVEQGSLVSDAVQNNQENIWSPSVSCGFSTPPPSSSFHSSSPLVSKSESGTKVFSSQLSNDEKAPLDFAVEAKPELNKNDQASTSKSNAKNNAKRETETPLESSDKIESSLELQDINQKEIKHKTDFGKQSSLELSGSIMQAIEAKEDDVDKEVSALTSCTSSDKKSQDEIRHNTPFCYTTQNLTAEPDELGADPVADSDRSDSLTKSIDEDNDEMYPSLQDADVDTIVKTLNRYRYISLCETQQPKISTEPVRRFDAQRSLSCPDIKNTSFLSASVPEDKQNSKIENTSACDNVIVTSCTFVPLQNSVDSGIATNVRDIVYEQLIPMALEPLPVPREMFDVRNEQSSNVDSQSTIKRDFYAKLSPPELLDRYLQLGSEAYINQLNLIPIPSSKDTDWTHFGGQPPADEIAILRNQILLLHDQLLFERHRKEVHSERNRRILGRAKTSRMQEEQILALKYQVSLLEKENQQWKNEHIQGAKLCNQLRTEKKQSESELQSIVCKMKQENDSLIFSNKKLQGLLVSQKHENDAITADCKKSQAESLDLKLELELSSREVSRCQKLEKDVVWMSKQIVLLQELNSHYKDKIEILKEPILPDIGLDLMKEAIGIEMRDLKIKLDAKTCHFEASKAKNLELEALLSSMKLKLKEQNQIIENMKALHKDELAIKDDRLADLKKVSIQKESHILELYKEIEIASEKIRVLERHHQSSNSVDFAQASIYQRNVQQNDMAENEGLPASDVDTPFDQVKLNQSDR